MQHHTHLRPCTFPKAMRNELLCATASFLCRSAAVLITLNLTFAAAAQSDPASPGVREISPKALSELLGRVHVIDVNEADNYAFAHVPGARLAAYDAITAEMLPADRSDTLVFYCWSPECPASDTAAETALGLGYTEVYSMRAGITGWQDAGLPTEP